MTTNIENQLEQLIQGQKSQAERDKIVLNEVASIRETVERLHERLDGIHEKTIIHSQKIEVIQGDICKNENKCMAQHELIWKKMREHKLDAIITAKKDIKLWLYGTIIIASGSIIVSIITSLIKSTNN